MVSKTLALLALSGLALAKPHGHGHQHVARHPHGAGPRGSGHLRPTGGFFPGANGTWGDAPFASGSGAGSIPVITQTVVPVPGGGDAAPTPAPEVPVAGGEGKPLPPTPEVPSGDEGKPAPAAPEVPSGDEGKPATPAPEVPSGGQGAPGGGQGDYKPPTDINNNAIPTTDVAGGNGGGAGGQCVPRTETSTTVEYVTVTASTEAALPTTVNQTDLSAQKNPSAGQFFGVPTGGFGGNGNSYGGQHGSRPQPTTFATIATGGYGAPSATGVAPAAPTGGSGSGSGNNTGSAPSGGKRGLAYNDAPLLSAFDGTGMSWAYSWGESAGGSLPAGVEFVPMCWGAESIDTCGQNAAGAKHVLSFNEPDLGEQSDMTPEAAAQGHIKALNPLSEQGARIGSPSITNGGAPMGIAWLNKWFKACGGQCKVDFVTFHWYDSANNFEYFKQHVNDVVEAAQQNGVSKVWLTEFGVTDGDAASFIAEATAFLDSTAAVERYAYFWAAEGSLIQGGGLSTAGKAYVGQ